MPKKKQKTKKQKAKSKKKKKNQRKETACQNEGLFVSVAPVFQIEVCNFCAGGRVLHVKQAGTAAIQRRVFRKVLADAKEVRSYHFATSYLAQVRKKVLVVMAQGTRKR